MSRRRRPPIERFMEKVLVDEENTYWAPDGTRACKECRRVATLASYHKRKEAKRAS